jgi:Heterokaryon incompatibility protein (HET)
VSDERQSIPFISKTTDSESTWRTARNWIDWCTSTSEEQASVFCKRTHSPCQNNIIDEKLPTRLVYVSENNKGIRLCLTKEISFDQGKVNYTALTHCWGLRPMPILTNRDNFQQMLCGIPFQSLTKTFQDAIIITRRLGYKYVWIDSLCILQGDIDDWVSESGIMGSIFAGCSVNIVAAAARGGFVGCFFDRDPAMDYGFKAYAQAEQDHKRTLWNFYLACQPKCFPNDRACTYNLKFRVILVGSRH